MHLRPPTSAELASIERTRAAYRAFWAAFETLPPRRFDGCREDIDALDFIDYELGGDHPMGLEGAAVVWAGVLVAAGALEWAIGDERHFVLVAGSGLPRAMIWPYARVAELDRSSVPQFGKYDWLLEEAVLRLWGLGLPASAEAEERLFALLRNSESFLHCARRGIPKLLKE
jgi:hypothetical protein